MHFKQFVAATALLLFSLVARADTSTFDFTYSSTSGDVPGETATGNGSFTVSYTQGLRTGTLTAFSFTDTIDSSDGDSTFSYSGLGDVSSSEIVLTLSGEDIARGTITTKDLFGTNMGFGSADFELQVIPTEPPVGSTSAGSMNAPDYFAADTTGTSTVTFVSGTSVTPEPSSFLLLCTGLFGMTGVLRKRFA